MKHRKNSLRLKGYDYFLQGPYFFTTCTVKRNEIFQNERIRSKIIEICRNVSTRAGVIIHSLVIAVDHIHGLVRLPEGRKINLSQYIGITKVKVSHMVQNGRGQLTGGQAHPYADKSGIWQRSYYEHIIRNEQDFNEKAKYIENHPFKEDGNIFTEWH